MPNSRKRHKHPNHQASHHIKKQKSKAAILLMIIVGIFGLLLGGYASDANILWMIVCAIIGALIGYMIGRSMDRSLTSKKA